MHTEKVDATEAFIGAFIEITKSVADIELENVPDDTALNEGICLGTTFSSGCYNAKISCCMEESLMDAVVIGMNSGKRVSEENKRIFIREYYNVIYGRAISKIGTKLRKQARLTVPTIFIGQSNKTSWYAQIDKENIMFSSKYGVMKLKLFGVDK